MARRENQKDACAYAVALLIILVVAMATLVILTPRTVGAGLLQPRIAF